ncbi:MAG: hypothetical protein II718_08350 [Clostridiales bacterium]|nr:hypothetical protein [Clostridiales bacterium]
MIKELKTELKTLYEDLTVTGEVASTLISMAGEVSRDRSDFLKDLYFRDNSKLKVMETVYHGKGDGDSTMEMINISAGYDNFVSDLHKKAETAMKSHERAVIILTGILRLPSPHAEILYFRYLKRIPADEIEKKLNMSRTTYFRYQERGIVLLDEYMRKGKDDNCL